MKLKIKDHSNKFGTPSHPSPLDRIRTGSQSFSSIIAIWRINYLLTMLKLVKTIIISGKRERARELGITSDRSLSFEGNQSFPKSKSRHAAHTLKKPTKILTSAFPCLFFQKIQLFHLLHSLSEVSFFTQCVVLTILASRLDAMHPIWASHKMSAAATESLIAAGSSSTIWMEQATVLLVRPPFETQTKLFSRLTLKPPRYSLALYIIQIFSS